MMEGVGHGLGPTTERARSHLMVGFAPFGAKSFLAGRARQVENYRLVE